MQLKNLVKRHVSPLVGQAGSPHVRP
jgi:hypothetical protein